MKPFRKHNFKTHFKNLSHAIIIYYAMHKFKYKTKENNLSRHGLVS